MTALVSFLLLDKRIFYDVLDTETFVWSRLRVLGTPPEHRYGHTMDVSGSDILLFGGWTKTSGARFKHEPTEESCDYFMIWSTDTMSWKRGKYMSNPLYFDKTKHGIGRLEYINIRVL